MKPDAKGTPGQRWAHAVNYRSPRECYAQQIDAACRCRRCKSFGMVNYMRRDGGFDVRTVCGHPCVPGAKGIKIDERGTCDKWERKNG